MYKVSLGATAQLVFKKLDHFFINHLLLNKPFFRKMLKNHNFKWLKTKINKNNKNSESITKIKNTIYFLDRDFIRTKGTRYDRELYHEFSSFIKCDTLEARQKLGQDYINKNLHKVIDKDFAIDRDRGFATISLQNYPPFKAALAEARQIVQKRADKPLNSKGSLDFLASSKKDFDSNSAIAKLVFDPNLLVPITKYFGILPILFGFDINRASSREVLEWSSHLYHLDPEDTTQIKVFIYLDDVDENAGPFTTLPVDKSEIITKHFNYTVGRLKDEEIYKVIGYGHEEVCLGSTGTTIFCDTNRCFHYGGRIKERERYVLTIYYSLPTSTWFPLFDGDGERRNLTPLINPVKDSEFEKALLGYELV